MEKKNNAKIIQVRPRTSTSHANAKQVLSALYDIKGTFKIFTSFASFGEAPKVNSLPLLMSNLKSGTFLAHFVGVPQYQFNEGSPQIKL